jgi:hypothetical protein
MQHPAREAAIAGQARVISELLAETNGPNTTSELLFFGRKHPTLLPFADYHGTMPRVKTKKPRSSRVVLSKPKSRRENSSIVDTLASIRRGLAQARKGEGQLVDDVFNELEREG